MTRKSFAVFQILVLFALSASAALFLIPQSADAALTRTQRFVGYVDGGVDFNTSPFYVTSSFTPSNNSLLVVSLVVLGAAGDSPETTLSVSGGGLTWTKRASTGESAHAYAAQIWTAPVTTGASMTVTVSGPADHAANGIGINIFDYTGYNRSSPIGETAAQGNVTSITLSGAPALTSEVLGIHGSDCTGFIGPGFSGGFTELNSHESDCNLNYQTQYRDNSNLTTVDWDDSGGAQPTNAAVEIKASTRSALVKPPNNLGLVGYWSFNDGSGTKATDFSGNGNTGSFGGVMDESNWVNGKRGKALYFSGDTQWIDLGNPSTLRNGDCTVAAWVKTTNDNDEGLYEVTKGSTVNHQYGIELGPSDGSLTNELITVFQDDAVNGLIAGYTTANRAELFDGKWHHVVVTEDTATRIYLDGVSKTVTIGSGSDLGLCTGADANLDTFRIGNIRYNGSDGNYFLGTIDDVRVYNRALSASEVANLYNQGTAGASQIGASSQTLQNGTTLASGLVGLWTFDGYDLTDKIYDRSGQGNNGYFFAVATSSAKAQGKLGQALQFTPDTTQQVNVGNDASLTDITRKSVCAWIYPRSFADSRAIASKMDTGPNGWELLIATNPNSLVFVQTFSGSGNAYWYTNAGVITLNQWQHVCAVYDRSSASNDAALYVNGAAVTVNALNGSGTANSDSAASMMIGDSDDPLIGNAPNASFDGRIDDVRIYNRLLSAAEVKQLYKLGSTLLQP